MFLQQPLGPGIPLNSGACVISEPFNAMTSSECGPGSDRVSGLDASNAPLCDLARCDQKRGTSSKLRGRLGLFATVQYATVPVANRAESCIGCEHSGAARRRERRNPAAADPFRHVTAHLGGPIGL